jgi:hypothetical protein
MSNLTYTGTVTGGTGIVNLGSGQFYKDASGNVGINTTSPDAMLDIERETASGTGPAARFYRNQATIENLRGLSIYGNQSGGFVDSTVVFGNTTDSYLAFGHHNGTSYTERMRIDASGILLVGKTATNFATQGLEVRGVPGASAALIAATRDDAIAATFRRNTSDGGLLNFNRDATSVGSISVTTTATAYNTSSDYRLKENVAPMTGALATVAALKPVTYTWKSDGSAGQGFIAHELQVVMPDCVTGKKDAVEIVDDFDAKGKKIGTKEVPRYQGVDTSFLVATLVAAVQELTARLEVLENK